MSYSRRTTLKNGSSLVSSHSTSSPFGRRKAIAGRPGPVLELGLGRSRAHHEPRSDEQKGGYTNHRSLLTKMATYTALSLGDAKAGE